MVHFSHHDLMEREWQDQLSAAERQQLTVDCLSNPAAFDHIRTFSDNTADEREALNTLFNLQDQSNHELAREQTHFDKLIRDTPTHPRSKSTRYILASAGEDWRGHEDVNQQRAEALNARANAFSVMFARSCRANLDGSPVLIYGTAYEYQQGFMTTPTPDTPVPKPIFFASLPEVQNFNSKQLVNSIRTQLPLAKLAVAQNWYTLLGGLEKVSKF